VRYFADPIISTSLVSEETLDESLANREARSDARRRRRHQHRTTRRRVCPTVHCTPSANGELPEAHHSAMGSLSFPMARPRSSLRRFDDSNFQLARLPPSSRCRALSATCSSVPVVSSYSLSEFVVLRSFCFFVLRLTERNRPKLRKRTRSLSILRVSNEELMERLLVGKGN